MNIHLKAETGYKEIIDQLTALTKGDIKIEDYNLFFDITIDTSIDGDYLSIVQEKHYSHGDYVLQIWSKSDRNHQVYIPFKFIDCIFKL